MCWGSNLSHHWSLLSRREETKPKSTSFPSSRVLWSSVQVTTASGENIKSSTESSDLDAAQSHIQLSTVICRVFFTPLHLVHFLPLTHQPKRRLNWSFLFHLTQTDCLFQPHRMTKADTSRHKFPFLFVTWAPSFSVCETEDQITNIYVSSLWRNYIIMEIIRKSSSWKVKAKFQVGCK